MAGQAHYIQANDLDLFASSPEVKSLRVGARTLFAFASAAKPYAERWLYVSGGTEHGKPIFSVVVGGRTTYSGGAATAAVYAYNFTHA